MEGVREGKAKEGGGTRSIRGVCCYTFHIFLFSYIAHRRAAQQRSSNSEAQALKSSDSEPAPR